MKILQKDVSLNKEDDTTKLWKWSASGCTSVEVFGSFFILERRYFFTLVYISLVELIGSSLKFYQRCIYGQGTKFPLNFESDGDCTLAERYALCECFSLLMTAVICRCRVKCQMCHCIPEIKAV